MNGIAIFAFGLGLFFAGLTQLGGSLKQIASHRFRVLVKRYAHPRGKALLFGLVSGTILQSSSAALMILASLAASGLVTVGEVLPILATFNVGDTVLIFLATFDIRETDLLITGLAAILLYFVKREDWRRILGVLMGLGLIFFGISQMREGVKPLQQMEWVAHLVAYSAQQPLLSIAVGVGLGFVMQSSTVVAAVGVGLVNAGLLDMPQTLVMAYASAVGSSLFKVALGASFTGSARQVVRYQNIFNFLGAGIFILLFYIEKYLHVPLVMALVQNMAARPETQVAIAFLLFKITSAAILTAVEAPLVRWLEKSLPQSAEEELSRPKYLSNWLPEESTGALELVRREQLREIAQIADFFSTARPAPQGPSLAGRLEAISQLGKEVESATRAIMGLDLTQHDSLQLAYYQSRQTVIIELAEVAGETVYAIGQTRENAALAELSGQTLEALEFLLMSTAQDLESEDPVARTMLLELCGDRGPMMAKLRKAYLQPEGNLSLADRSAVLALTNGMEKCVWLLRRLVTMHVAEEKAEQAPAD